MTGRFSTLVLLLCATLLSCLAAGSALAGSLHPAAGQITCDVQDSPKYMICNADEGDPGAPIIDDTCRKTIMEQVFMNVHTDALTLRGDAVFSDIQQMQGNFFHV